MKDDTKAENAGKRKRKRSIRVVDEGKTWENVEGVEQFETMDVQENEVPFTGWSSREDEDEPVGLAEWVQFHSNSF